MIAELRKKNEELLKKYEGKFEFAQDHTRQIIIKEMLTDKNVFKEIEMEVAYAILKDLEVKSDMLDLVYLKLISK